jgi:hypothetical protein
MGRSVPVFRPRTSTPLDDQRSDSLIPKVLLWAMKDHRRNHYSRRDRPADERRIGEGDHALYVIDAGMPRATVGRLVGSSPDGCTYCLVAALNTGKCADLSPRATSRRVLASAANFTLCAVYDGGAGVSNVSDVERFARLDDVPDEYLPPHPFISFSEVL